MNDSWYKLRGAPWEELARNRRVQKFVDEQYLEHNRPIGMALFKPTDQSSPAEQDWLFFTPEAARVCARMLTIEGGYPCAEPSITNLECIAGNVNYAADAQ